MKAETLTVLFLFGTVILRLGLIVLVMWLLVPRRRRCAACGEETAALQTSRVLAALRLEKRWCLACGWWGFSKRISAPTPSHLRRGPMTAVPRT